MKVLLCSPYKDSPNVAQGGIVVWAQNIMDYYSRSKSDLSIKVVSYDRKVRQTKKDKIGLFSRFLYGLTDYREAIKETSIELKREKYDVLHLCTSASISLLKDIIVLKMAKRKDVKTIVHFHFGRIAELANKRNWEWKLLCRVLNLADRAITMDLKSFSILKEKGFNHVYYLPNPLSHKIINQIEECRNSITKENSKLCYVGHVIPTKGVYELMEACKGVEGIQLDIVGSVADDVKERMLKIADGKVNFQFVGEISHPDVIQELLSSGIFVLPTYTEGFPNVIIESMACGCAIVTTPVGAIPEMLDINGERPCGLCSEPRDVEALRKNILYFVNNKEVAKEYGERAIQRVNRLYSISIVWKELIDIWGC